MTRGYDYQSYAILYVDDEEKSLKYFHRVFDKDFTVLTASSASQAWDILERDQAQVGVLIVDQRMPRETGVELLGRVRRCQPNMVRILTTAYSDLDAAIEGVNSGAIFRYVTKPWDVRDLRGVLLRAMEFFLVQRERDILLREKLSILQRIIVSDRVRCLAVMAAGLAHNIRNSITALVTFLNEVPGQLQQQIPDAATLKSPEFWDDLWSLAQQDSRRLLQIVQDVIDLIVVPTYRFDEVVPLADLLGPAMKRDGTETGGIPLRADIAPNLPHIRVDRTMAERLFNVLLDRMIRMSPPAAAITLDGTQTVQVWGTPGVKILISGDGPAWTENLAASLFTVFAPAPDDPCELGLDLLSAYFIAYHHGGDIVVHKAPPKGPGFEVVLPFDPEAVRRPPLSEDFLERVFTFTDIWDGFRGEV